MASQPASQSSRGRSDVTTIHSNQQKLYYRKSAPPWGQLLVHFEDRRPHEGEDKGGRADTTDDAEAGQEGEAEGGPTGEGPTPWGTPEGDGGGGQEKDEERQQ